MTIMGCMVDHIHLIKIHSAYSSDKGTICGSLLIIIFNSECVHIYVNKLIKISQTIRGGDT
jgi:hypothetical protein